MATEDDDNKQRSKDLLDLKKVEAALAKNHEELTSFVKKAQEV